MKYTKLKHNHLAEGEVTGHYHAAVGPSVSLWGGPDDRMLLKAPQGATVTHQEHLPVTLPVGEYERLIVQEYDHFAEEARSVRD